MYAAMPSFLFPRKDPPNDKHDYAETPIPSDGPHTTSSLVSTLSALIYDPSFRLEKSCGEAFLKDYVVVFVLGAASGLGGMAVWRRWGMRLRSAEWVTPNVFARRRWVRGVVTSVGDADNFRLYHTPGLGWRWPLKFRNVPHKWKDLKAETLHIRIAGVDAPEAGHFGRPPQPYAEESLAWLKNRLAGRTIYCQLIRKDQYGRIIGVPLIPRRFLPLFLAKYFGSPLAFEMLRAGAGTTYTQAGAEHGPWGLETFLRIEEEARVAKRGMWRNGVNIETPGEYKRRYAVALGSSPTPSTSPPPEDISESNSSDERTRSWWFWRR